MYNYKDYFAHEVHIRHPSSQQNHYDKIILIASLVHYIFWVLT